MTNEQIIWNFLYSKIKNSYGTAGLMGNLFAESSLNPILANNVKKKTGLTNEQYTAAADTGLNTSFITDGIAYGLAQWCYHTRKKGLYDKAKANSKSVGDINIQLDYLWEELQKYKTVLNTLYGAKSVREASDIVLVKYEKPATQTEAVKALRAKYGQKYYDKYAENSKDKIELMISALTAREILRSMKE
jgi:hypothetical protein